MERLTKVIDACGKTVVVYTRGKYEDTTAGEMEHKDIRNVMKHLSAYEDTGLTPQEIIELKERDTAKNPDIIGVDKDEFRIGRCPKCGVMPRSYMRFCPNCGQRLKWEGRHEDIRR